MCAMELLRVPNNLGQVLEVLVPFVCGIRSLSTFFSPSKAPHTQTLLLTALKP